MEGAADWTFHPLAGNSITKELFLNTVGCKLVYTMLDNMVLFFPALSSEKLIVKNGCNVRDFML